MLVFFHYISDNILVGIDIALKRVNGSQNPNLLALSKLRLIVANQTLSIFTLVEIS